MTNAVNIAGLGAALTVSSNVVNFSSTPTVAGSPIGASAATPTALGTVYGKTDTSNYTAALGYQASNSNTGVYNVAVGYQTLYASSTATGLCAVGTKALNSNTTGFGNTAVGSGSPGSYMGALQSNTTGTRNTAVGVGALATNVSNSNNVAVGMDALIGSTSDNNVAIGDRALSNVTTGSPNTSLGAISLKYVTTGSHNIGIGYNAGESLTTGSSNIYIGSGTVYASSASVNNELVIAAYTLQSGKGSQTALIFANSGAGAGGSYYNGANSSSWNTTSDQRLKKNIVDHTEGLNKIVQIRVRNFEYRLPEEVTELPENQAIQKEGVQLGVIAQELKEVLPDCVKTESTGVMSVQTDEVFWHMVNAIKDLKALNDTLIARITALEAR